MNYVNNYLKSWRVLAAILFSTDYKNPIHPSPAYFPSVLL